MSRVLVVCEQTAGALHPMSLEAAAAGQAVAKALELPLTLCLYGAEVSAAAGRLAGYECEAVVCLEHEALAQYTADGAIAALAAFIGEVEPRIVLFPHTYQVRDFAPALAARCGRPFVSDVTAVRVTGAGLRFDRPLFQGKLRGEYSVNAPPPVFASIQAGSYRVETLQAGNSAIERRAAAVDPSAIRQEPEPPFREAAREVDLTAAERIVAAGRGIHEENLNLVRELAGLMGAEVAASRPICDNGWLPMERQIGSSGQTVAPKLYVALGISGAIQHLVGMKGSKTIVAVNTDPKAPIFEVADYGIVGDLFEVAPALIEELKKKPVSS